MKLLKSGWVFTLAIVVACVGSVSAEQGVTMLTRAQWLTKIGTCVTSESVLRETLTQVAEEDKVEFTQRILKAVTRMPVRPEEKSAAFVRAAVSAIASVKGSAKYPVIAEVFADVPIEFLPVVTDELAKRFNQEYNSLTDEQYEKIAVDAVRVAITRNARTEAPSVRNAFVIIAFLRGSKNPKLKDALLALLPDKRMRSLVASWLPMALDGNYESLLAAADVEALRMALDEIPGLVGHSVLDRLLSDLGSAMSRGEASGFWVGINDLPSSSMNEPVDFGINRIPIVLPGGYQNQTTSIYGDDDGFDCEDICPCVGCSVVGSKR